MVVSFCKFFQKKILCSEKQKFRNNNSELQKNYNTKIRPPLVMFFSFMKKITTTKSSTNFLSPEPYGQGFYQYLSIMACWPTYK